MNNKITIPENIFLSSGYRIQGHMPTSELVKMTTVADLPDDWDRLATSYFQKKRFLSHCETFNACHQRYYLLYEGAALRATAVVYTLQIDLFTFSSLKSPVNMQVIGLPASVSAPGVTGAPRFAADIIQRVLAVERGLLLGVNLAPELKVAPGISMPILPNVALDLRQASWADYQRSLRSSYRRRLKRITAKFGQVEQVTTNCSAFSARHYQLYLAILKRTPSRLETLTEAFFKNLPPAFQLTTCYLPIPTTSSSPDADPELRERSTMLCWSITCREEGHCYFFFGGMDYDQLEVYDSYFNNLFGVLKIALEQKCTHLDLGQTAEIPKMRLGGALIPKQMFLYHHRPVFRWMLRQLKPLIGYRAVFPEVHVFKKGL
jgi:hypothetical protein